MEEIRLIRPSIEFGEDVMQFRKEIKDANDNDSFAGCGSLKKCTTIEEWLQVLAEYEHVNTCPTGSVTSNTYLAVRTSDKK